MSIQKTRHRIPAVIAAIFFTVMLMLTMFPTSSFAEENAAVTASSKGVLQVNMVYHGDNNQDFLVQYGSGFLINSDTVLTCDHVLSLNTLYDEAGYYARMVGKSTQEFIDRLSYTITVDRDVTIDVSNVINQSQEMDFAILKLAQSLQGTEALRINKSGDVKQTEKVYAIGFPGASANMQAVNKFNSEDVTITEGIVNKAASGPNPYTEEYYGYSAYYDYIQTSVVMKPGNSGGPMVDDGGNVIGICQATYNDYYNAIAIDQVTEVLDKLGVEYTKGGVVNIDPNTEPEPDKKADKTALKAAIKSAEKIEEKGHTAESFAALETALDNAKAVDKKDDATQDEIDKATRSLKDAERDLVEKKGLDLKWIIIIAAGVVVIAAVIIIIAILASKKKKQNKAAVKPQDSGAGTIATTPPVSPIAPQQQGGFVPPAPAPVSDAGETTVLSSDAGETTVLSHNIEGGVLISAKTGEKIHINTADFTIGRERSKVNYHIAGNTSVGRVHAKIVNRNGAAYLVDMKATNGTFVNGVKCTPMEEVQLKSGDKITFSNEEYTYQA